jgi:hypothetical protein
MPRRGERAPTAKVERNRGIVVDYDAGMRLNALARKYDLDPSRIVIIVRQEKERKPEAPRCKAWFWKRRGGESVYVRCNMPARADGLCHIHLRSRDAARKTDDARASWPWDMVA